jgi:Lon protease-like protein
MICPTRPDEMPLTVPLFPLEGALLLPTGDLPLNIFEPRYVAMTHAALAGDRLIAMIQPCPCAHKSPEEVRPFYSVGCIGRISNFEEMENGHFLINLRGVARFTLLSHVLHADGYRLADINFSAFAIDFKELETLPSCLSRETMITKLKPFLEQEDLAIDWHLAEKLSDARLYTILTMVCPFSAAEKQALLEAVTFEERCRLLHSLLDMACAEKKQNPTERMC